MKKKIFIGSKNKGKIEDYKNFLGEKYDVISPYDLGIDLEVEENDYSLIENSTNKALAWAKKSGLVTLSEDSGFFIKKLNGKPGISVKTWGGEYEKELDKKEFLKVLKEKIETLDDTSSYFLTSLSIAFPSGEVYSILHKEEGYIDKNKFGNISTSGYPLSSVFIANGRGKTWSEMTNEEKKKWEQKFIDRINKFLDKIY